MPPVLQIAKVRIRKEIIDRKDWVKYLVIPDWHVRQLGDLIEKTPDAKFNQFVEKHVQAYLGGKAPPETIMSAVMNIADDYAAGREIAIKAGDYVALQNEYQQAGK